MSFGVAFYFKRTDVIPVWQVLFSQLTPGVLNTQVICHQWIFNITS